MKVLCEFTPAGPSFVRSAWGKVFNYCGHDFRFWAPEKQSAFDAFSEYEPDLFIGTTYGVDRAVYKNILARPDMKVILFASAWGKLVNNLDRNKYPIVIVNDEEKRTIERLKKESGRPNFVFIHVTDKFLEGTMGGWGEIGVPYHGILNAADVFDYCNGKYREELSCDCSFVGGYWAYKSRNLDKYILPLCHPTSGLKVKIFGNQPWPVHQYLGHIDSHDVRNLFVSSTICPNVSEPHSTDLGWDLIERPLKVLSSGGFCVSDYVEEGREVFTENELPMAKTPERFRELIYHFIENQASRNSYMEAGKKKVLISETYFDRVARMMRELGLRDEEDKIIQGKARFLQSQAS